MVKMLDELFVDKVDPKYKSATSHFTFDFLQVNLQLPTESYKSLNQDIITLWMVDTQITSGVLEESSHDEDRDFCE
ncbi:hypothetical protein QYF36_011519 [Acer negundo]|nr:hypothetical protein QYF36_011519 [Acer negundo]